MTRRSVLAAVSLSAAAVTPVLGGSKTGTLGSASTERAFDPTRHGFGFYNWRVQDGPYPETDEPPIETHWRESFERAFDRPIADLPDGLLEALSHHAREGLLEAARTNGYCYGMVFAAQKYFEQPETIPGGFDTASEITDPNAPQTTDKTPILEEIMEYHAIQYLDFHAWFGRYALFDSTLIDYESQLTDLYETIDAFGTAGITVFTEESVRSHQVLVYDYERYPDRTVLLAYDPNYTAESYERFTYSIEIDTTGETPKPKPVEYGVPYDQFVHNEYDRLIREKRESSGPLVDDHSLYDRLFDTTLFVTTNPTVEAAVFDPSGRRLEHTTGGDSLHYRYGASNGTYTISLTGQRSEKYTLDVYASSRHRTVLEDTIEGSITPGETLRYEITIDHDRASLETGLSGAAVLGVVGGGYAYHRRS